jgi:hypothetical protein
MARAYTVELTARAYAQGDARAALALLEQSMARGQRRIALLRYLQAQYLDAPLDGRHHDYVQRVAAGMSAVALEALLVEARKRAGRVARPSSITTGC